MDLKIHDIPNTVAECGMDGIVCSPVELSSIKEGLPDNFFYLTPGVRSEGSSIHDYNESILMQMQLSLVPLY